MTYFRTVKGFLAACLMLLSASSWAAMDSEPVPSDGSTVQVSPWLNGQGPRREGSTAEVKVFEALDHRFGGRVTVNRSDFLGLESEHSFSQQLWFRIPGRLGGDLVVVVPTDGPNDRGLAWAVDWASAALDQTPPVSLTFLFTGAERAQGPSAGLGSRTFLQNFYPAGPTAVVYLDATGADQVRLTIESGAYPSPLWMVQGLASALETHRLVPRFTGAAPSLFRFDLPSRRNALAPWFDRSIPGILIASGPEGRAMVEALQSFTASLPEGIPSTWDRHYLMFDWGNWKMFWGQRDYLVGFLGVAALLLFGYTILGRRRRGSLRVLASEIWQLPVLVAFGFLALLAATEAAGAVLALRGDPGLWKRAPLAVAGFKVLVACTLYLALFLPFRRSPLSRDPDFYAQAALAWLGIATLVAAAIELSFSFYFLWALVWSAVFVAVRWRWVKTLALGLGPLWLFKAAFDVTGPVPDVDLIRWVLASPLAGNFLLDLLCFPFLLQVNAWHLAGQRHQHRNEGLWAGLQLTLLTLGTLVVGVLLIRMEVPLGPTTPAAERIDVVARNRTLDGQPGLLPYVDGLWTTKVSKSAFLDRSVWNLTFGGRIVPEALTLNLSSDKPLLVFDCNFPVVLAPDGRTARIVVGREPTLPLELRLTLPQTTRARLSVEAQVVEPRPSWITDHLELGP